MRDVVFKAMVKGMTADAGKVEVKLLVDVSDVTAHEGLVSLRGQEALVKVTPVQERMGFDE